MERPILDRNITVKDFQDYYWLKKELTDFCKTYGISTIGGKIEITQRIIHFLQHGEASKTSKSIKIPVSKFNWNKEELTLNTLITDNYKNTENVRAFFINEIGNNFSFNVKFMNWLKANTGKTLKEAIQEWKKINEQKKDKNYQTEIAPQFEYNRYIRAFLADNPTLSTKQAMKYWKLKSAQRGTNQYEKEDLGLQ